MWPGILFLRAHKNPSSWPLNNSGGGCRQPLATRPPCGPRFDLYRQLLLGIGKYLSEMEVPQRFIEFMMDTTSAEIRWLTNDEAESMEEVPSIAEWLAATCEAMIKSKTARETSKKR
jgi:hypothetical protein